MPSGGAPAHRRQYEQRPRLLYVINFPINTTEGEDMKTQKIKICLIIGLFVAVSLFQVEPVIANDVVIVGEINEEFQIVADGIIYEVADNEQGNYLVSNLISAKVKVTGTVSELGGIKVITVSSFEVLAE
jgi:hypothetical protein